MEELTNVTQGSGESVSVTWGVVITDRQRQIFTVVNNIVLSWLVCLFGTGANVINMFVFYKQGLNSTINISFFAMAVSDLSSLILQHWYIICAIPGLEALGLPMVLSDVQYLTGGVTREAFSRISCLITVYITAERCFCIAFPLHVKQMITPRMTIIAMASIYILTWLSGLPLYCVTYIDWRFYSGVNKTLLGLVVTKHKDTVEGAVYFIHTLFGLLSVTAVSIFTLILIRELGLKNEWRKRVNVNHGQSESMSNRDRTTMTMIVLVACLLIVCYTPASVLCAVTFCEPEFTTNGAYFNLYLILWSFAMLFETINSSGNIFLYFKMSTKYRITFRAVFKKCGEPSKET